MNRIARAARIAVPLGFLALFFAYPVAAIIGRGIVPHGHLRLGAIGDVLGDGELREVAWFTFWQAAVSTALTIAVALPGAYVLSRYRFRGRALVRALATVPFVMPTIVVGSAFSALHVGYGVWPILLAHVFFNYAVVVRTVGTVWEHLDPRQEEAARMLGASRWQAWRAVTFPALQPAILAAASIVFLFTFTSFGVILILGGPQRSTLEVEIYRQTTQLLHLRTAAVLSLLQMTAVLAVLAWIGWAQRRRTVALTLRAAQVTAQRVRSWTQRVTLGLNLAVMAALLGIPLGVLVVRSFDTSTGFGLDYYRELGRVGERSSLFVPVTEAIRNSLLFGVVATAIAVTVGGLAAFAIAHRRGRSVETALMLPLGTSAVTVGFGYLIAFDHSPLDWRSAWLLIPLAHAVVAVPFVMRVTVPALRALEPRLREVAAMLGASPAQVWRAVDVPIAARALTVAAGFAFAISLGEFGATAFIVRPDTPTLPIIIYRLLGQPGSLNFGEAMAASTVLIALTALVILTIERFRVGASEF